MKSNEEVKNKYFTVNFVVSLPETFWDGCVSPQDGFFRFIDKLNSQDGAVLIDSFMVT